MFLTKCTVYKTPVIGTYSNSILGICQVITDFKQVYTCDFARVSTSGFTSRVVTWILDATLHIGCSEKKELEAGHWRS